MRRCMLTVPPAMPEDTYEYLCARARERFGDDLCFERRNEDVIGGFMLELDGTVHDLTLRTQLDTLRTQLQYEEGQT